MKNPFAQRGFDTYIGKEISLTESVLVLSGTTVIDGSISYPLISGGADATLIIGGRVTKTSTVEIGSLVLTGVLECDTLIVQSLAVKEGATLKAKVIKYNSLSIENGAMVTGLFEHGSIVSPVSVK